MKKSLLMTVSALMIGTLMLTGCGTEKAETTAQTAAETTEAGDSGETTKAAESGKGDVKGASGEITVVSREDGSGTRGAFIELLGIEEKDANGEKMDMTTEDAKITNSTSVMMTTVEGDVNAIGYISLGSLNESVTAVKVDGAEATADNVAAGTYKVQRPFNIATNGTPSEAAQDFINFIMSKEGQAVVVDNGYIAVGDQPEYEAGNAEGKIVVAGSSSVTPVMEKLKEAYLAVNKEAEIEVQESDSTTGMTAAMEGTCDIGMASRELKDSESELKATAIAMDGIAVIVNKNNTLDDITSDQVKDIYLGDVTSWDEL